MYVHTHTRIHTYIHRFIYIHVCVCECFLQLKFGKSIYWNINKTQNEIRKKCCKTKEKKSARLKFWIFCGQKIVWFDFSSLFRFRLFSSCVRKKCVEKNKGTNKFCDVQLQILTSKIESNFIFLQEFCFCFTWATPASQRAAHCRWRLNVAVDEEWAVLHLIPNALSFRFISFRFDCCN